VAEAALVFDGGSSHELGGGSESPRHFVYDIDRDGDLDFLESGPLGSGLALHINFANQRFDLPQILDVDVRSGSEAPFVQVGPVGGIIGHPRAGEPDSAIYVLVPALNSIARFRLRPRRRGVPRETCRSALAETARRFGRPALRPCWGVPTVAHACQDDSKVGRAVIRWAAGCGSCGRLRLGLR
jgi:hypothetical protein